MCNARLRVTAFIIILLKNNDKKSLIADKLTHLSREIYLLFLQ